MLRIRKISLNQKSNPASPQTNNLKQDIQISSLSKFQYFSRIRALSKQPLQVTKSENKNNCLRKCDLVLDKNLQKPKLKLEKPVLRINFQFSNIKNGKSKNLHKVSNRKMEDLGEISTKYEKMNQQNRIFREAQPKLNINWQNLKIKSECHRENKENIRPIMSIKNLKEIYALRKAYNKIYDFYEISNRFLT